MTTQSVQPIGYNVKLSNSSPKTNVSKDVVKLPLSTLK